LSCSCCFTARLCASSACRSWCDGRRAEKGRSDRIVVEKAELIDTCLRLQLFHVLPKGRSFIRRRDRVHVTNVCLSRTETRLSSLEASRELVAVLDCPRVRVVCEGALMLSSVNLLTREGEKRGERRKGGKVTVAGRAVERWTHLLLQLPHFPPQVLDLIRIVDLLLSLPTLRSNNSSFLHRSDFPILPFDLGASLFDSTILEESLFTTLGKSELVLCTASEERMEKGEIGAGRKMGRCRWVQRTTGKKPKAERILTLPSCPPCPSCSLESRD
jgi:hypothetical protein